MTNSSKTPKNYKEIAKIPKSLIKELPTSYDFIGDIILIKLRDNLLPYKNEIGLALLKSIKHSKTVCLIEPVKGELRTRNLEIIAGEEKTITTHKEYGLKFELDVSKVYFSSRLATERKRITDLVEEDEVIIDMFSGVAPFSIMIAKYSNPKIVYSIDKNEDATKFAKRNVIINKVLDKVEVICENSKNLSEIFTNNKILPDRIIMNLPFSAISFFEITLDVIGEKTEIHLYDISKENEIENKINLLHKIAKNKRVKLKNIKINKIKSYAPREFYIGIDITAIKI